MTTADVRFDSLDAAQNVAYAYEDALQVAIQLSRIRGDAPYAGQLQDHLDQSRQFHKRLRTTRMGPQEWGSFCKAELRLMRLLLIECTETIEGLLE
jgi:hypothetical protein